MEKFYKRYKIFEVVFYLRVFPAVLALGYLISIKNFLAGKIYVFHDNLPYLSDLIISQSGPNVALPQLRSFHQTQSIPTWQNSEMRIGFDPFSIMYFTKSLCIGIEPTTYRLKADCSTAELSRNIWRVQSDSNRHLSA